MLLTDQHYVYVRMHTLEPELFGLKLVLIHVVVSLASSLNAGESFLNPEDTAPEVKYYLKI